MKINDYTFLINGIQKNIPNSYQIKVLGKQFNKLTILLVYPKSLDDNKKNILIVSTFHGNENAPPWSIYLYIVNQLKNVQNINISFIPVVNVCGFINKKRYNKNNQTSNWGYMQSPMKLSEEGKILINNINEISLLSKDGFYSMHENVFSNEFYLYLYNKDNNLMSIQNSNEILHVAKDTFDIIPDGKHYLHSAEGKFTSKNGKVINEFDGSFEDYLFETKKCKFAITTETPAKANISIMNRIKCNYDIIKTICNND